MIVWRIVKRKYAKRELLLSGQGAKEVGGRWNRSGLAVVYASATSSLALLETLVHAEASTLPSSLVAVQIVVPDDTLQREIKVSELPKRWREVNNPQCIEIGSRWIESGESLALKVPSAVNPMESNVLLNPAHVDISRCKVGNQTSIQFDPRVVTLLARDFVDL